VCPHLRWCFSILNLTFIKVSKHEFSIEELVPI
jgi:hypothetical protein